MSHLSVAIASTAIKNMLEAKTFSICAIRDVGQMLGINPEHTQAYKMLQPLHCIAYANMPSEVVEAIPQLIRDCYGGLTFKLINAGRDN